MAGPAHFKMFSQFGWRAGGRIKRDIERFKLYWNWQLQVEKRLQSCRHTLGPSLLPSVSRFADTRSSRLCVHKHMACLCTEGKVQHKEGNVKTDGKKTSKK